MGAKTVVLTRGMDLVLRTCPETLAYLQQMGIGLFYEKPGVTVHPECVLQCRTPRPCSSP